jgi:Transposase, Mutator family
VRDTGIEPAEPPCYRTGRQIPSGRCGEQGVYLELVTKPVFVGLDTASTESGDAWEGFLSGLGERGRRAPLLVISDGAPGLIGAIERTMGGAPRQRCLILIHRVRILAKVPKNAQAESKRTTGRSSSCPKTSSPASMRSR